MKFRSSLYVGSVMHRRMRPWVHALRYRVFWMLIDLDEIGALDKSLRLFSYNSFNAASFYDKDHGDGSATPLRVQVEHHLRAANISIEDGRIELLCMPRILGYGFNPLSIYFCYAPNDEIRAILYEVHNTFGERHSYLIPVASPSDEIIEQHCDKGFYVSPFMDMEMTYAFRVCAPGERTSVAIHGSDKNGLMIAAALTATRRRLSDATLLRALITFPLLTLKVIAAIHWHAFHLILKGLKLRPRPAAPAKLVTTVDQNGLDS